MAGGPKKVTQPVQVDIGQALALGLNTERPKMQHGKLYHLSRIVVVPFGTNILGLSELLASIGLFISVIRLFPSPSKIVGTMMLLGGILAIMAFDMWWRMGQLEVRRWERLFSLFTGGCFIFLPIWLLFPFLRSRPQWL